MPDTCKNPDVELTVFRIVFYEILIKNNNKNIFSQGSDTNLELNTRHSQSKYEGLSKSS